MLHTQIYFHTSQSQCKANVMFIHKIYIVILLALYIPENIVQYIKKKFLIQTIQ